MLGIIASKEVLRSV